MVGRIQLFLVVTALCGCQDAKTPERSPSPTCDTSIKRAWDDTYQETRKTTEVLNTVTNVCIQKRLQLTNYEKGLDARKRADVTCAPQSLGSAYLVADGNFYGPRNGNVWLALEPSGQFRRLTLGQTTDGRPAFSRDLGCWYARTDHETEPVNPQDYGSQLLLDLGPAAASSEDARPIEIFKYSKVGGTWTTTRFDQNYDIDYSFCPESLVPWAYCTALRNGNPYFEPDNLDVSTKSELLSQAIAIRSEFNFTESTQSAFEQAWQGAEGSALERPIQSWQYATTTPADVPNYVWSAWRDYVMRNRPAMPDAYAVNLPVFCYAAKRKITYIDGSTGLISGEACYDGNGGYEFH